MKAKRKYLLGLTSFLTILFSFESLHAKEPLVESEWIKFNDSLVESIEYSLNKNKSSNLIKKGSLSASLGPIDNLKRTFPLTFLYKLEIYVLKRNGKKVIHLPEAFFEDNFIKILRKQKVFETKDYYIYYKGIEDISDISGVDYPNCDHLLVKMKDKDDPLKENDLLSRRFELKNIETHLYVTKNLPLLGAVEIALTGKILSKDFVAVFDLK